MAISKSMRLKLELMISGMHISKAARQELAGNSNKPLSTADYVSTSGIPLLLKEDIWVNAPIAENNPNIVKSNSYTLDFWDGDFFVFRESEVFEVMPIRVPQYISESSSRGTPFNMVVHTHTDRARVQPIQGCALDCSFCDWRASGSRHYSISNADDIVEGLNRAFSDPITPAKHILISGGTPRKKDYGSFIGLYERVAREFPGTDIDVMMMPATGLMDAQHLKDSGITGIFVNLEFYDLNVAQRYASSKFKLADKQSYLTFIESAVNVYGVGKVKSLLMLGLEDLDSTLLGIRALAERGCDPILSPHKPDPNGPLRDFPMPSVEFLIEAYERAKQIVDRYNGVKLGPRCIACHHNTLTFPDGTTGYYYTDRKI